jgi:hypothetical protein
MRVKGHGLQREGRAHDKRGRYVGGPVGHGLCSCGAMSEQVGTTAARQRWHLKHKQEMGRKPGAVWSVR